MQVNGVGQTPAVTQTTVQPVQTNAEVRDKTNTNAAPPPPPPPDAESKPTGGAISRSSPAVQAAVTNLKTE